jgi:8-oxo-dGTP pyrophosphatase MutT (NUDIX family)
MLDEAHVAALRLFRWLPRRVRRWVVRGLAPSYTVGAICLIERADGAVLLVKQVYRKQWGVPGGLLKRGEEAEDAARREVLEEVGLAVELVGEPAVVVDAAPQRIDVVFRARPADGTAAEAARPSSPEIVEVRWFKPDALPELQKEASSALVALARSSRSSPAPPLPGPTTAPHTDG